MKSILLSACIIAFASCATFAQNNNQAVKAPVANVGIASNAQFSTNVKDLDKHLKSNHIQDAQTVYSNLQKAMEQSMILTKTKMASVSTPDERNKIMDVYKQKQSLYVEIHNLSKDLPTNRQAINDKLNEFSKIAF